MAEGDQDVQVDETTANSSTENKPEVDANGVPLQNRLAEAQRKLTRLEAENALLKGNTQTEEPVEQDEAIKVVKGIAKSEAEEQITKRLEPLLARQFLLENPNAASMIDEINRVRAQYPELKSPEKLDLAYKIAKAEKQAELDQIKQVEEEQAKTEQALKANNASLEGTGTTSTPSQTVNDRIAEASTLKELEEAAQLIQG